MRLSILLSLFVLLFSGIRTNIMGQGYLHVSGKYIKNVNGEEVILRGIGTGNWMLQEGYMMKTADFAGTQHELRQKMVETFGEANTNTFYQTWLDNHFTRRDADSLSAWGFNSLRVALHYKWFTLPIEEEPVEGQDTWLESGFVRIDSLLDWCGDNQMYLILDLHGAPGGQGHDANISDYDDTKLSLWESAENRRKTVALWARFAQRYANEPWLGGYDLINEPNWDLPNGVMLKNLYLDITNAIRAVDHNHIIFIEGNWFANDFTGLTPPWDNNMVYSFHKYWTYNTLESINWMINMRNTYNVPIWLGESGENSNSWFTSLIALCEQQKIGWSWWPVKKAGINNVLLVHESASYNNLLNYWKNGSPAITPSEAFAAVMDWADKHRIENCTVQRDVIDAMIRQPFSDEALPFRVYKPGEAIHAVNYDLGKCSSAYWDTDTANYHLSSNTYTAWNAGWQYRNDGVDIEACSDNHPANIGYDVGWVNDNEWLQYTIEADSTAAYTLMYRSASNATPAIVHLAVDGTDISSSFTLPQTGGWQTWMSATTSGVILPAGTHKVRLVFDRGGSNFHLFSFLNPVPVSSVPFQFISAATSTTGDQIMVTLNKDISTLGDAISDFIVTIAGSQANITAAAIHETNPKILVLNISQTINYGQVVKLSYNGNTILSDEVPLSAFNQKTVKNNLPKRFMIPARIQAEDFDYNNGFQLEDCSDVNGGKNVGYANNGDYLDYNIYVAEGGEYTITFRVASQYDNGRVTVKVAAANVFTTLKTISFTGTGGWQQWENQSTQISLQSGNYRLRLYSAAGEYNLNWFEISKASAIVDQVLQNTLQLYPNPGNGRFTLEAEIEPNASVQLAVCDVQGRIVWSKNVTASGHLNEIIDLSSYSSGLYILQVVTPNGVASTKLLIE
ncbi:MAG: carbohydrate-binding protein [Bacteroidales bacterium]|nr:carbohydrate-binding protein [Bacteroidales bacterium]